jgi:hypothetical protein
VFFAEMALIVRLVGTVPSPSGTVFVAVGQRNPQMFWEVAVAPANEAAIGTRRCRASRASPQSAASRRLSDVLKALSDEVPSSYAAVLSVGW